MVYNEIKENFYFRLTTQNRFPKEGIFYPIGFLKQIFYKRVKNELWAYLQVLYRLNPKATSFGFGCLRNNKSKNT